MIEIHLDGKKAVMDNCEQVAGYFKSITTKFRILNTIADGNRVAVSGTAEFIRDGKRVNFVSACDVYEFNDTNKLMIITSFCIADKK